MEQKLLSALPVRTAWTVLGICALFWLLSALGLLQLPPSVPAVLMFLWLYLNALAALASALAAAAAVAALLLHRRNAGQQEGRDGQPAPESALDQAEETGLDQLLDGPGSPLAPLPAAAAAGTSPAAKRSQRRKRRKR
ncbi:hypothetical protein [Arthrobacter koreensis]|uniref:hypothetical protein n=1 Tax=Arthrobacter koreensis TaxID=199136 RepID=UPI002DBC000D|nr:hypothetical protein [Arthrobacter koreensis]MEB7502928.1 hypothetical protein [Arthrobacter koreensis]